MKNQQSDTPGSDIQARRDELNDRLEAAAQEDANKSAEQAEYRFYELNKPC